ncbi:mechanosensitive ion channel, partial [bacterium]|nr:mechanosensitive ion channel [bacterium]
TFVYSLRALGCTAAVALPLPLVLWVLGWNLTSARVAAEFPKALGVALWQTGWVAFPLGLFRQVCRPRGLGQVHFRWRGQTVDAARRAIGWWLTVVLPILTLVFLLERQSLEAHKASVGRLAFLAAMILTSVLFYRLMRVRGPLFAEAVTRADRRLLIRTRSLWFPVLVSAPVLIAAAAGMGYLFTAAHLFSGLLASFLLVLGLILARALILRWLSIQRRRVALRHMEDEGALATQGGPDAADQIQVTAVEHLVSLMEVREQTLSVLAWATGISGVLGLYLIWVDVLPALGILNEVALWGQAPPAGGGIVSLADLLLAIGALVLASTVGVNLPGLLEVTFLHWFAIAPGTRYAVTTMARYVVSAVAVVVVAALLGLRWASIQWLVAALTVGLGFGLQEIFANFVSGLIILFERPIRVGDTVTIGDISGTVSRIRIRATTITDWDRKELIVPNREFITGRLVNWTLSDSVIRIRVNTGIAYGSDVAKATECLLEAAKASAHILKEPAPEALFLGFGNSSLGFELRVYVQGFEHYFSAINDLHRRIDAAFRASGVEIAFPQQDLHIRSVNTPFTVAAEPVKAPVALPPAPEPPASPEEQPGE